MSEEPKTERLWDVFYELGSARRMLEYIMEPGDIKTVINYETLQNLYMLLGITEAKIDYYTKKYGFEIDQNDNFLPEEITQFLVFHTKGNSDQKEAPTDSESQ